MHYPARFLLALACTATAFAGEKDLKSTAPVPAEDPWKFQLSMPGWIAGVHGDSGINGLVSHIDASPDQVLRRVDMTTSFRGEVSKGRLGLMADFLYLSLSDGVGGPGPVKKVDVQFDQITADLGLRWRLLETPRASLDVIAGVRYTNVFQKAVVQANGEEIERLSAKLVDDVSAELRDRASDRGLREKVAQEVTSRLNARAGAVRAAGPGRDRNPTQLPAGPLDGRLGDAVRARVQAIIDARKATLAAAVQAKAQAVGAAARAAAQQRVEQLQRDLTHKIADAVEAKVDTRVARTDDWWDPYIGLRARYDFTDRLYVTAKGDIGGFGVGSDLTWQASAAVGVKLSKSMYAEVGYRALGVQYDHGGLYLDTITHGAQIDLGLTF